MKIDKNEIKINENSNPDQINLNHILSLIANPKETNKYLETLKEQLEEYYTFNNNQYNELTKLYNRFNPEKNGKNFINTPIYHLQTIFNKMIQMQIKLYESIVNTHEIFNLINSKFVELENNIEDTSKKLNLSSYFKNIYKDTNPIFTSMMQYMNELETKVIDEFMREKYKIHTLGTQNNQTSEDLVIRIKSLERSIYDYFQTKKKQYFDNIKESDNKVELLYNDIKNYLQNYITNLKDTFKNFYKDLEEFENNISSQQNNTKPNNISQDDDNKVINSKSGFVLDETDFYTTKYKIKIISSGKVVTLNNPSNKDKNNSSENEIYLKGEEIFEIVSKLYSYELKILDKSQYVLEIEKGKLFALDLSNKLLSYSEDKEETKIKLKQEYEQIMEKININIVNNIKNIESFFTALNNYRATSKINFSEIFYDIVVYIYSKAQEFIIKNANSNKTMETLMLILSQTYFKEINGKKIYILEGIKSHELYQQIDFWKNNIFKNIEDEFKILRNYNGTNIINQNKKEEIIRNKIFAYSNLFKDYEFNKNKIIELLKHIFDKYKCSEDFIKEILSYINQDTTNYI